MADLGTSAGLRGQYKGDSAQNNPAYIKPLENNAGDDIISYLDKQEKKKQDDLEAFDKQVSPYLSIDGSKYLPERVPEIRNQSMKVLQEAMSAKNRTRNVMFDENVQKEVTKLQELQNKYTKEALIANEFQKKMLTDQAFEYDDNIKESVSKAIEGRAGLDDKNYISSEMIDKGRNFSKYRKPEERVKFLQFHTPNANSEVVVRTMENGNYVDKNVKGSEIYSTPEGLETQRKKFEELAKTSQNPFVKGYIREAEEEINANDDLVFQENFKDLTPLEAQDFISKKAADLMLRDAVSNNKLKTVDKVSKVSTGFNFTNNFQPTGGGGATGKVFNIGDPIPQPLYAVDEKTKKPMMDKPLVKNGRYFSIQTVTGAENAPKVVLRGQKGAVVQGIVRDEESGKPEYAKVLIPEVKTKGRVRKGDEARETYIKLTDTDISDIRTNIGADQYDATIGNWTKKENTKAAPTVKEELYIYNGKAYPKSKLEQQGWDVTKLKKAQ